MSRSFLLSALIREGDRLSLQRGRRHHVTLTWFQYDGTIHNNFLAADNANGHRSPTWVFRRFRKRAIRVIKPPNKASCTVEITVKQFGTR